MEDRDYALPAQKMKFSKKVLSNLELNRTESFEGKKILKSYPIKIYVEPTQRCNLDCWMCDRNRRKEKKEMDLGLFNKIERELFPYAAEVNFFLTGEPTLAKNFEEIISSSKRYSFLPKIFTNANNLTNEIIKLFVELGFFVNISIDAAAESLYKKIRCGGNFNSVIKNIKKMQKLNMKIKNKRFHLRLASTIGMHNISESPKIIELARELGINDVMFGAIDLGDKSKLHLSMNPRKAVHFFQQAKDLADKYKIRFSCPKRIGGREIKNNNNWDDFSLQIDKYFSFQLEESNPLNGKCGYPWIQTAIRANGDVISCCQREHILGSMKKNSFFKIWNNKNYQRLRSQKIFYNCLGKKCNMAVYSIWK